MKKIYTKLLTWWWFTFKNPTVYEFEFGGFKVVFKRFFIKIKTISGNLEMKFMASEHPYGYLYAQAASGKVEDIHGFCAYIYKIVSCLTSDQGLANDINKALTKYDKRMAKKAKSAAKDVTDKQASEDLATVELYEEYADLSDEERGAIKDEMKNLAQRLNE